MQLMTKQEAKMIDLHFFSDNYEVQEAWHKQHCFMAVKSGPGWKGYVIKFPEDGTPAGTLEYSFDASGYWCHVDSARRHLEKYANAHLT